MRLAWARRFPDTLLYGGSAGFALLTLVLSAVPVYRRWAWIALCPYAAGSAVAAVRTVRASVRLRAAVAGAVFVGAVLVPLALGVAWRDAGPPGSHVQSETLLTEEAAKALVHGNDPYATNYLHGPLAAWPPATKTHFPYLPAMTAFGLPRAAYADTPLTDARVAFLAAALACVAGFGAIGRLSAPRRLVAFQAALVLPTAAVLLSGGGDDVAVGGLMLLAVALVARRRPLWAGVVAGLAAATKQLAWPLLPFLVLASRRPDGRPARTRAAAAAAATAAILIVPFVAWHPRSFVIDAIRFPLGYGKPRNTHPSPTPGVLLARAFPGARTWLAGAALVAVLGLAAWLAWRDRARMTPATAARDAGAVLVAAILLGPATRIGFVVYPLDLMVAATLLSEGTAGPRQPAPGATAPPALVRGPG